MVCSACGSDTSEGPRYACCEDALFFERAREPEPPLEDYCAPHPYAGDDGDHGRCYCGMVIYVKGGPPQTWEDGPLDDGNWGEEPF